MIFIEGKRKRSHYVKTTTRRELVDTVAYIAGVSSTTVSPTLYGGLQSEGLLPRGGKGENVDLNASHRVNLLLGAILDRPHGTSAAETVKDWRALPLTSEGGAEIARTLGLDIANAGNALDSVVANLLAWPGRSPILEAKARGEIGIAAEFHAAHMALQFYALASGKPTGTLIFGSEPAADETRIERISRLLHPAFLRLAQP
jgi:hypothetical protein